VDAPASDRSDVGWGGLAQWRHSHRRWRLVAVAVAIAGLTMAVMAADSVATREAEQSRAGFEAQVAEISAQLELALQHEADLVIDAGGYLSTNPDLSAEEFQAWIAAVGAMERYPEVQLVGIAKIVPASELDDFASQAEQDPAGTLQGDGSFEVFPPGDRPFYCFFAGQVTRSDDFRQPAGLDICGLDPTARLLTARDQNTQTYTIFADLGTAPALVVQTPAYRGGVAPDTVAERRAEHVGWVGTVLLPTVILEQALVGHDGYAIEIRYLDTEIAFDAGEATAGSASATTGLGDDWNVTVHGPVDGGSVLQHREALVLLVTMSALSLVLAGFIYLLGTGRARALRLVADKTDELRHQALHDSLTGLPNRALILDRTEQLLARNRRQGTLGAALFIDLDEFKTINDTLGHETGDRLLQAVAARLTATLRDADTIGRLGGDEFVVLIDDCSQPDAAELVAQRILDVTAEPFDLEGVARPLLVSTSIGIATGVRDDPSDLLRDADVALYQAKAAGKNCHQTFRADMEVDVHRRFELELRLRSALACDQFHLVYQPIYDLDALELVGAEALLRWDEPELGSIPPSEFIPLLEASGQITEVGAWVLQQACRQMAGWREAGADLAVSVNLSGRQLSNHDIMADVRQALEQSGLEPSALTVEITETALMRDLDAGARRLQEIKAIGVNVAIDDFGTGYSSLSYLQRLPVDSLKIDRGLTNAITRSPESNVLINSLVQLGKDLGLKTLAVGVETTDQIDHLRGEQVDQAQGFLLARPLDPETFAADLLHPTADRHLC
jgi:diguanylate cyclase (GGDEF)-like protein